VYGQPDTVSKVVLDMRLDFEDPDHITAAKPYMSGRPNFMNKVDEQVIALTKNEKDHQDLHVCQRGRMDSWGLRL